MDKADFKQAIFIVWHTSIDLAVFAQVNQLKHMLGRGSHFQRLVKSPVVVEADQIPSPSTGVLQDL